MTPDTLLRELRELDAELHSSRVTAYYRTQSAASRERFVALRAYVARALADATHARLEELAGALEEHDAEIGEAIQGAKEAVRRLDDAVKAMNVVGDLLTVLAQVVPGVLDRAL